MSKEKMLGGYILAVMAVFIWSFNVVFSKILVDVLTPWQITFLRWFVAMVCLLSFNIPNLIKYRKVIWDNIILILFMALTGTIFTNTSVYMAGRTISANDMSLIGAIGPIFLVSLSALFLKEKINTGQICGFCVTIFGLIVIISRDSLLNLESFSLKSGDWWMLFRSFSFGIYGVLNLKKPKKLPQVVLLTVISIITVLTLFPIFVATSSINLLSTIDNKTIILLVYLGIANSIIAYLAWNSALNHYGSVKISIFYYLIPVFSMVESAIILKEKITLSQIYGGFFVILGILMIEFYAKYKIRIQRA